MAIDEQKWAVPHEVTDVEMAFPAEVTQLMPEYKEIPDEFKRQSNSWVKLQQEWFFEGLPGAKFFQKEGINPSAALRHLKCIQGSFQPKHEHKEAAVAYLLSRWFDKVQTAKTTYKS